MQHTKELKNTIFNQQYNCKKCKKEFKQRSSKGGRKRKYCQDCAPHSMNLCKCKKLKSIRSKQCNECYKQSQIIIHNRNEQIESLRQQGQSLGTISKLYNLSRERINQICKTTFIKHCEECQKEFTTNRIDKIFCNSICVKKHRKHQFDLCICGNKKLIISNKCKTCFKNQNATDEEIKNLYDLGYSINMIAKEKGLACPTVLLRARKLGLNTARYLKDRHIKISNTI